MMKSKWNFMFWMVTLIVAHLCSCAPKMEEYYEVPDWLKGNAWEVLEAEGNCTLFMEAVEVAGYKDLIQGRGIITVLAPTDEAFSDYLKDLGVGSAEDLPLIELQELIGYHLVYYAFDQDRFFNYRPEGISTQESTGDAGLYYKFRTKSSPRSDIRTDQTAPVNQTPPARKIYHKERFLPVLSSALFKSKGIDASDNYAYFFPGRAFPSEDRGFRFLNAGVREYAIVADNGYVYIIDEVLDPAGSVHQTIAESEDYRFFLDQYDRFSEFRFSDQLTQNYGAGDSLFLFYHQGLPKIASMWSYNGEGVLPDYADMATLSRLSNNVFAPNNAALDGFFIDFWGDYYSSMHEVPFVAMRYLLENHVFEGDLVFPEEIEMGKIRTRYGDVIRFDTGSALDRALCANGAFYGLDEVVIPRMFESVTAPVFQQGRFSMFLQMMDETGAVQPLMSEDLDFSVFLPSNSVLQERTTVNGKMLLFQNLNPNRYGEQSIMIEGDDEPWVPMSYSVMNGLVNNHITTRVMTEQDSYKVLKTQNGFQYLLLENEQELYSSFIFNNYPDQPAHIEKLGEYYNGVSYGLAGEHDIALSQDYALFKDQIRFNTPTDLAVFKQLLDAGGLSSTSPAYNFLQGERFIVFAPTQEAVNRDLANLPSMLPAYLSGYMKHYFVRVGESGLSDYPFAGAGVQGTLKTFARGGEGHSVTVELVDEGGALKVVDPKGNVHTVVSIFPKIYSDGCVYMIDGMFEVE